MSAAPSYIMLTPTATASGRSISMVEPARDLLARKWAASTKRRQLLRAASAPSHKAAAFRDADEDEGDDSPRDASPTETDRSSDADPSDAESESASESASDDQDEDARTLGGDAGEDELGGLPTYVCELHDPKPILIAEQVPCLRVDISVFAPPKPTPAARQRAVSASAATQYSTKFKYEISIGRAQGTFECTPARVVDLYKTLLRDRAIAEQLRFIETQYFQRGLLASIKRFYAAPAQLSDEIIEVLEWISDVDAVLLHPAYLSLIGAKRDSQLHREIERLAQSHKRALTADPSSTCMCETYAKSVERFGEFYAEQAQTATNRQSTVASESLMWSRGVLSFYMDTIYLLDKRDFRPLYGLKKCTVYGFGRRRLFEVVRVSRKQWALRHCGQGGLLYTLTVEKYVRRMNTQHMVTVKRRVPDVLNGGLREEDVCFVKKSKKYGGYRCLLMAEVMSKGKVATAISMVHPASPKGDPNLHYVTMSELAGEPVCSSTLSVPGDPHKRVQRLHVSGGSDVAAYVALSVSYDLLASPLSYWMDHKY